MPLGFCNLFVSNLSKYEINVMFSKSSGLLEYASIGWNPITLDFVTIFVRSKAEDCPQGSFFIYRPHPTYIFTKFDMSNIHMILTRVDVSKKVHIKLISAGNK